MKKNKLNQHSNNNKKILKVKTRKTFLVSLSKIDMKRIRYLLFMGIILKVKKKKEYKYKTWVQGFPHLLATARTPVSAYRRLFKLLREKGIYFP